MKKHEDIFLRRGNLMWEGSRMMLPEHIQALREYDREKAEDPKPHLTEDELTDMGHIAFDSMRYTLEVKLTHWHEGYYTDVIGIIDKIDTQLKQVKINDKWIKINLIKVIERL
ncbi:YolD-like family protein [Salipaludibacillus agaradhaerens]|uniref:YolD-like family protein n=1 Tax=Salipaludibacillus agaradhaerens TaxID=76935 RepID=A0A9Q4FV97_SALAG|nr:YolD-like family protein [Salipaludibacillus agaradhaerens]MCR6095505.1 YolD-like family protein [Salipaludibacillus agaradhaerens]MCR6107608.1 YolD-like family protein [Salipaludibacillus agaradhaerens]MCR6114935.1 YolD-like family protein [Salipaludibacillus agaradhaerens]MCR6119637.1 YolD-like family protein [Salipaludibacillus agaradhaerens]